MAEKCLVALLILLSTVSTVCGECPISKDSSVELLHSTGIELLNNGDSHSAAECFQLAVAARPTFLEARYNLAKSLFVGGNAIAAYDMIKSVLEMAESTTKDQNGISKDAMNVRAGAVSIGLAAGDTNALAWLDVETGKKRSAKKTNKKQRNAEVFIEDELNWHIQSAQFLSQQGRWNEMLIILSRAREISPTTKLVREAIAWALGQLGRHHEAEKELEQIVAMDPDNVSAIGNRAVALENLGRAQVGKEEDALEMLKSASERMNHSNVVVLSHLATALHTLGRQRECLQTIDRAVSVASSLSLLPPSIFKTKGFALLALGERRAAADAFKIAVQVNKRDIDALRALGGTLTHRLMQPSEQAEGLNILQQGFDLCKAKRGSINDCVGLSCQLVTSRSVHAAWGEDFPQLLETCLSGVKNMPDAPLLAAHSMLSLDVDPKDTVEIVNIHTEKKRRSISQIIKGFQESHPKRAILRHQKPSIFYIVNDLNLYNLALDTAAVIRSHDHSAFDVSCLLLNSPPKEASQELIEAFHNFSASCPHFQVVQNMSSFEEIASLVYKAEADVVIDMSGWLTNNRIETFFLHPAPLQIHFGKGFAGPVGSGILSHIISDPTSLPPELVEMGWNQSKDDHDGGEHRIPLAERVLYIVPSYFPALPSALPLPKSRDQMTDQELLTIREKVGIPPQFCASTNPDSDCKKKQTFVISNFNQHYKIDEEIFAVWMRVLHRVPHAVLWLSNSSALGADNFQKSAAKYGISSDRIIFLSTLLQDLHVQYKGAADVFVDSRNYNAHGTAIDALTAGVPLLTPPNRQFAARTAAGILKAGDCQLGIARNLDDYEEILVQIGNDPEKYKQFANCFQQSKIVSSSNSLIFNVGLWTRKYDKGLKIAMDLKWNQENYYHIIVNSS